MRRFIFVLTLLMAISVWGLTAEQGVTVIVPSRAFIMILSPSVTLNIPSIEDWPVGAETMTRSSQDFYITSTLNTLGNSDMVVTSTVLQSGVNGPTIPLSDLRVNLNTFLSSASATGTLDNVVIMKNIGVGIRITRGRYDLTVNASQQAGTYTGTVTYTLVNN